MLIYADGKNEYCKIKDDWIYKSFFTIGRLGIFTTDEPVPVGNSEVVLSDLSATFSAIISVTFIGISDSNNSVTARYVAQWPTPNSIKIRTDNASGSAKHGTIQVQGILKDGWIAPNF